MIQIDDYDMPIEAANKLIHGTRTVKPTPLQRAAYMVFIGGECVETIEEDMFDLTELKEIADHLYAYVNAKNVTTNEGEE